MAKPKVRIPVRGNLIDGEFRIPTERNGEWVGRSPADETDVLGTFARSYVAVDEAVRSSCQAYSGWKGRPLGERAEFLKKYQELLRRREDDWAEILAREVGKPLWEARLEVASMIMDIDVAMGESMRLIQDFEIPAIMEGTHGVCRYRPHGVMAVIGPSSLPAQLPNGHIVPALLTGNTVILKPSERAPLVGQLMAECLHDAGLPRGVFNMVQGDKEVGRRLCVHEDIDGVLFNGSYDVSLRIKQDTLQQHWKILALQTGGKNPALVWEDADLDQAIHETLVGAFITAGQRCTSTTRILVHHNLIEQFVEKFHERAKVFAIGHPLEDPFMGPLIDSGSVDRYMKFLGIAVREGAELVMRGKSLELPHKGNYVTPSICWIKEVSLDSSKRSIYQQTEVFGPNVAILGIRDLDEAIAQANVTQFGLAASVFTKSRQVFEHCFNEIEAGQVNWNRSTVEVSPRLPLSGLKKSGNYHPAGLAEPLCCTYPVSSLERAEVRPITETVPGLNWK